MKEEVRIYLQQIAEKENYLQLMKDLVQAATNAEDDHIWDKTQSFCQAELVENIDFIVTVARQVAELGHGDY